MSNNWSKSFDTRPHRCRTLDGPVVFARPRQCAAHLIMLPSAHPCSHHKRNLDRFGVFSTAHGSGSPILYNIGRPFSPQNCLFVWGIWTPSNTWFPWAHRSSHPKCHLDRFSRFCTAHGRVRATDRPTDRARYSVCSNRPHLRSTVMRLNNMKLQGQ